MRAPITFFVTGSPKGQPRPRATRRGNHAGVYDPGTADAWKSAIRCDWKALGEDLFATPVKVELRFIFTRPKSHLNKHGEPKLSAPKHHIQKPDVDNLAKAVLDALTDAGAWRDDNQVSHLSVRKAWDVGGYYTSGCLIEISEIE